MARRLGALAVCILTLAASCRDPSAVSENTPHQRGALAWVDGDGQLVVSFFVGCSKRVFTFVEVSRDGEVAWTATASGTPPAVLESVVVGSAPEGFTGSVHSQGLFDELTAPSYTGMFGVEVHSLSGETYSGSISMAERDHLTDNVVIWGGQLTRRSAVSCS